MAEYSPRMRQVLGYIDTDGDGVLDSPPASGGGSAPVDLSPYAKKTEVTPKADKSYVDTELAKKAANSSLNSKVDKTYVDAELAKKAAATALDSKADKTYVDSAVASAASGGAPVDLTAYALKSEVTPKADKTYVDTELAKKANSSSLGAKADKTYVDTELAKKADKTTPTVTNMAVQGGNLVLTYSNGFVDTLPLPAAGSAPVESSTPLIVPLSLSAGNQDTLATGA